MFSRKEWLLLAVVAALMAFAPAASAEITATPYGGTTDTTTGGHGDLTTGATFDYGSDTTSSVKKILIDTPAGGVGEPNAVPYEDRCTRETFETSTCDAKSQLGIVTISAKAWVVPGLVSIPLDNMTGTISQIQTDPEVPTVVGAYIEPPIGDPIRAYAKFYPVTSGPDADFRIRSETDDFPTTASGFAIQITKYEQKLFGKLPNGKVFITNPTRCDTWNSWGLAQFYGDNWTPDYDPFGTGTNDYMRTDVVPTEPNCATLAPFTATADATIQGNTRGAPAQFSTTLKIPGLEAEPQSASTPKTVVATLPDAVNVDVQQLGRICSNEQFAARACPFSTQVGAAAITTPMIKAGLQGKAYLVKATPPNNLPDLGIIVDGAIQFSLRGTNKFANASQIQTTFDNIPGVGFSSFDLTIFGGSNGLLLVDRCPSNGSQPNDGGSTRFVITDYQGQTRTIDSPTKYISPACISYSVSVKSAHKCLRRHSLRVSPTIRSRKQVRFVKYYVNGKYVKKAKKSPFKATLRLSHKLREGKTYRYKAKVYFKPSAGHRKGRVITKSAKFKICK